MEFPNMYLFSCLFLIFLPHLSIAGPKRLSKSRKAFKIVEVSSPTINVFEGINETLWETTTENKAVLIADNIQTIRLTCLASYPVRWKLEGLTGFNFVSGSTSSINQSGDVKEYREDLSINHLAEPYTGKYICYSKEFPDLQSSVFIFVPGTGTDMFVNSRGKNMYYSSSNEVDRIIIPCGVSHPDIPVVLQKSNEDFTELVNITMNVMYDPKEGFSLNSQDVGELEGRYFCSARRGGIVRVVEYNLIEDSRPISVTKCNRSCEENARCKLHSNAYESCECNSFYETFDSDPFYFGCLLKCKSNDDCPSNLSCQLMNDYNYNNVNKLNQAVTQEHETVCKNPCIYQQNDCLIGNTLCKVENHQAVC